MTAKQIARNLEILTLAKTIREMIDVACGGVAGDGLSLDGLTGEEEETLKALIFDDTAEID